jgi:hypothetical protein
MQEKLSLGVAGSWALRRVFGYERKKLIAG